MNKNQAVTADASRRLTIAIDVKNLALFTGGIAAFFTPLLNSWVSARKDLDFVLVGPSYDATELLEKPNVRFWTVPWPAMLPRQLRHPVYDNLLFSRAMKLIKPDLLFTPYHDVRIPKSIPSVIMVHDMCLSDLADVYPFRIRAYYLQMLKRNLRYADQVLTVSETSLNRLKVAYDFTADKSCIVPNAISPELVNALRLDDLSDQVRAERPTGLHIFYPGGSEFRKNIRRLCLAVERLKVLGKQPYVWVTGERNVAWSSCLNSISSIDESCFHFLGYLDITSLAVQYRACDVTVYPTLCEGFGRVVLEAMELGSPVACSDIEVLREVADDYPCYFDPEDTHSIAKGILDAATKGRQKPKRYDQYQPNVVVQRFLDKMNQIVSDL
mgnify:FL=1